MHTTIIAAHRILYALGMLFVTGGCAAAWPYSAHSINAKVVDSADGHPLQGVMVIAYWRTQTNGVPPIISMDGGGAQSTCELLANLLSTTTGADGKFVMPGWGPRRGCMTMYKSQPELLLYKPGYAMQRLLNIDVDFDPSKHPEYQSDKGTIFTRSTSRWDGATIKLVTLRNVKPENDYDAETNNLFAFDQALDAATMDQLHPTRCYWGQARPAYLLAMQMERKLSGWYNIGYGGIRGTGLRNSARYYNYPMDDAGRLHVVEDGLRMAYAPKFYHNGDFTCGDTAPYLRSLEEEADRTPPSEK